MMEALDRPASPAPARPGWRPLALVLVATAIVFAPALRVGLGLDDFWLLALRGPDGAAPYLVRFGDAGTLAFWKSIGVYGWWATTDFRWALMRPLSNALLGGELAAFGTSPLGYHAVSLALYLAEVAAAWAIYRRALGARTAVVALVLFATHFSHLQSVWLFSDQHSVLATVPTLLGLAAHVRWREDGWRPGLPLSLALVALGLSASETAVGVCGYFAAYELLGRRGIRGLVPVSLIVGGYLVAHQALGYGVTANGYYVDPVHEPGAFLRVLPERMLACWAGVADVVPAEAWLLAPRLRPAFAVGGAIAAVQVAWLVRRAWRDLPDGERIALRWLAAGAVLSLIPGMATFPGGRLLLPATVGGCALVATIATRVWEGRRTRRLEVAVAAPLLLVGGLLALRVPKQLLDVHDVIDDSRGAAVEPAIDPARDVVVVTLPGPLLAMNLLATRMFEGGAPAPAGWWALSAAPYDHVVRRVAPDTLEVAVVDGHMLEYDHDQLFRPPSRALKTGDTLDAGAFRATVLDADATGPVRVSFTFAAPLDDARWQVMAWQDGRLAPLALPPVGGEVTIPWSPGPFPRGM